MQLSKVAYKDFKFKAEYIEHVVIDDQSKQVKKTYESDIEPHDDLKQCFVELGPWLSFICEQTADAQVQNEVDRYIFANIRCEQVSFGGSGETCVLSGYRRLGDGNVLNLNAPKVNFEELNPELESIIESLIEETRLFLKEGKRAPAKQLEMEVAG